MDADHELMRAKWLMGSAVVFLFSGCMSWGELMYLVFGRTATADVTKVTETTAGSRRSGAPVLMVDFTFAEPDGTRRKDTDTVPIDWPVQVGRKAEVRYTPGADGRARLAGHVHWVGLTLFGVSCGLLAVFGFLLWREAREETRPRSARRR